MSKNKIKVLFVCMGNICRSPTAEGVFRKLVADKELSDFIETDSAGTHAYHIAEKPDGRAMAAAIKRNIEMDDIRARKVVEEDFHQFDYILAMDHDNFRNLDALESKAGVAEGKLRLFLEFAPDLNDMEVPDPYYGGPAGFEYVLDLVEAAAVGLLEDIKQNHLS